MLSSFTAVGGRCGNVELEFDISFDISLAALPFLNFDKTDFISSESGGVIFMLQLADIARSDSMKSGGLEMRDSGMGFVVSHVK